MLRLYIKDVSSNPFPCSPHDIARQLELLLDPEDATIEILLSAADRMSDEFQLANKSLVGIIAMLTVSCAAI